jgi:hypothetical protein
LFGTLLFSIVFTFIYLIRAFKASNMYQQPVSTILKILVVIYPAVAFKIVEVVLDHGPIS